MASEKEEKIEVEEEATEEEKSQEQSWTEEFVVAGEELVGVVKNLIHETAVRRVVVKNEEKHIHLEIPLALGLAGIALLPVYASLALIAALMVDCTILVERVAEKEPDAAG